MKFNEYDCIEMLYLTFQNQMMIAVSRITFTSTVWAYLDKAKLPIREKSTNITIQIDKRTPLGTKIRIKKMVKGANWKTLYSWDILDI